MSEPVTLDVQLVKVNDFADGDICVLHMPDDMTTYDAQKVAETMKKAFGAAGVKVVIAMLYPGVEVEMLRRAPRGNGAQP